MTLPANSTFLPVLDDLLSPDFRPVLLPAQTPQTPTDVILFGGAKFVTNACGNIMGKNVPGSSRDKGQDERKKGSSSVQSNVSLKGGGDGAFSNSSAPGSNNADAAFKIQRWWRSKRSKSVDIAAERAKHSIRHSRTEDHIRHLESEVTRLKSALSSERKIRSLQLEAIRSLWGQVQRILTSEQGGNGNASLMTRSVPNGFANESFQGNTSCAPGVMSMSMNAALDSKMQTSTNGDVSGVCGCTAEVQSLRESFSVEMNQLRSMINELTKMKDAASSGTTESNAVSRNEKSEAFSHGGSAGNALNNQKRPDTLNLVSSSHENSASPTALENLEQKEQIVDYASQMASKLVDDAVEEKEVTKPEAAS